MYFCKELLLPVVLALQLSFSALRPVEGPDNIQQLRERMRALRCFPMENLMMTEEDYVKHVFGGDPPEEYKSNTLEPLEGIHPPGGNTTEIEDSLCAIGDYLKEHLPTIIRQLTLHPHRDRLLGNVRAFYRQFQRATVLAASKQCHRNVTTSDSYQMKETGLRIIHFTRTWVDEFTNATSSD